MTRDGKSRLLNVLVVGRERGPYARAVAASRSCRLVDIVPTWAHRRTDDFETVIIDSPLIDRPHDARSALQAGKSVLCAPPLSDDEDEARDLAILAEARGLRLATSAPWRFIPPVRDALAILKAGAIGKVEGLRVEAGRRDRRILPMICDLSRAFLGEVVSVQAQELFVLLRNHDRGVAELRWDENGGSTSFDILGSEGYLHVQTDRWRLSGRLQDGHRGRRRYLAERLWDAWTERRHNCPRARIREIDALARGEGDGPLIATGWDGCRAIGMAAAILNTENIDREVVLRPLPVRTPAARRREPIRERE